MCREKFKEVLACREPKRVEITALYEYLLKFFEESTKERGTFLRRLKGFGDFSLNVLAHLSILVIL